MQSNNMCKMDINLHELKVATAIAILRSKPEGVNVKQYVQQLCDDYKQRQEQYRIWYLQAKETILQLRQQQIIAFSQAHNVAFGQDMGPTSTDVLPSPPCSEGSTSEDFSLCVSSPHVLTTSYQFIQSVVHLLGSLEDLDKFENMHFRCTEDGNASEEMWPLLSLACTELHSTLKETVTACIKSLQRAVEYDSGMPVTCLQQGLEGITNLLSHRWMNETVHGHQLKNCMLKELGDLIDSVMSSLLEPVGSDMIQPLPKRRLLFRILTHFAVTMMVPEKYAVLTTLVEYVQRLCSFLRTSLSENQSFSPDCYERLGYALDCLHNGILSFRPETADLKIMKNIQADLESSLLHLTSPLPFLAHEIWRLCAMIETLLVSCLI